VIYVENYPQKRFFRLADYHPPLWWGGVNQRTIYICSDHICACRGVNSGRHDSPYIRKLSLDHDSGEKNRGCHSVFQKYSTLLVFTSVTHASPSLTASLAIIVPTRSPFFEISKSQKSEHATGSALAVPISLSRSARLIKKRERLSWSLNCIPRKLGQPRTRHTRSV
jgi:hypothetical protein